MCGFFVKKYLRNIYFMYTKKQDFAKSRQKLAYKNSNYKNHHTMIKFYTLRIFHQNFFAKSFYKMPQKFLKIQKICFGKSR